MSSRHPVVIRSDSDPIDPLAGPGTATAPHGVDLSSLGAALNRRRAWIAAATLVCALVAWVLGLMRLPVYEAEARVVVLRPPDLSARTTEPTDVAPCVALLQQRMLAQSVIDEFQLARPAGAISRGSARMEPAEFIGSVLQVRPGPIDGQVHVLVRLTEPDLARRVANRIVTRAIELEQEAQHQRSVRVRDSVGAPLEEAGRRLQDAERRFLEAKRATQVDAFERDVETALDERGELPRLMVDLAAERARADAVRAAIEERRQQLAGDGNPARPHGTGLTAPASGSDAGSASLDPVPDRVLQQLELQAVESRGALAALEARVKGLSRGRSLETVLSDLYERQIQISRLEQQVKTLERVYADLATRYEEASIQAGHPAVGFRLLTPATQAVRVGPRVALSTLLAAAFGFVASLFLVVAAAYLRGSAA